MAAVVCGVFVHLPKTVHFCEGELTFVGKAEYLVAFGRIKEFAVLVQQFKGVPLAGVMRSSKDKTAACVFAYNGKLGGGSGCKIDVYYIETHAGKSAGYKVAHHRTGEAGIAAHNNGFVLLCCRAGDKGSESCRKLNDVYRREAFAGLTSDSSADAGNRFYKAHKYLR